MGDYHLDRHLRQADEHDAEIEFNQWQCDMLKAHQLFIETQFEKREKDMLIEEKQYKDNGFVIWVRVLTDEDSSPDWAGNYSFSGFADVCRQKTATTDAKQTRRIYLDMSDHMNADLNTNGELWVVLDRTLDECKAHLKMMMGDGLSRKEAHQKMKDYLHSDAETVYRYAIGETEAVRVVVCVGIEQEGCANPVWVSKASISNVWGGWQEAELETTQEAMDSAKSFIALVQENYRV